MSDVTHEIVSRGVSLIGAERARQIQAEGYTPAHDHDHEDGSLAMAAAVYAEKSTDFNGKRFPRLVGWPWRDEDFKPTTRLACLVKAGALIAAEIDRLEADRG